MGEGGMGDLGMADDEGAAVAGGEEDDEEGDEEEGEGDEEDDEDDGRERATRRMWAARSFSDEGMGEVGAPPAFVLTAASALGRRITPRRGHKACRCAKSSSERGRRRRESPVVGRRRRSS